MCHMVADTPQELLEMADRIGVARRWIQARGTWKEHFDICKSKRARAVQLGAIEMDSKALVRMLVARRNSPQNSGKTDCEKMATELS